MPAPSTCTASLIGGVVVGGVAVAAPGGEALGGEVEVVVAALGGAVVAGVAAAAGVVGVTAGGLGTEGAATGAGAAVDTVTGFTLGPHAASSRTPATESDATESGRFPQSCWRVLRIPVHRRVCGWP